MNTEETLAWEAQHRPRAAIAAFVAAGSTLLGLLLTTFGQPRTSKFDDRIVTGIDALGRVAAGRTVPPGQVSAYTVDLGQNPALPIAGAIFYAIGTFALFFALGFLFRATRARKPEMPQLALIMAAIGAVAYGVGRAVTEVARDIGAAGFVDAIDKSNSAAREALTPSSALVGQVIWELGSLSLAVGFILIALNAMRVGLLTRFMGVLGIIVGVAVTPILPLDQQGIIRIFWLGALGMLILGRMPSGVPKAWVTGQAEPWPSQQQQREQREAARAEAAAAENDWGEEAPRRRLSPTARTPAKAPPPTAPTPRRPDAATAGSPHSASKKRKRKRRSP
jgi:hypothetical protein